MSLSTWLFGKKKSPTSPAEDNVPITEETDEFVIIERGKQLRYPNSADNSTNMYSNLPYSLGPPMGGQSYPPQLPTQQHELPRQESQDSVTHSLNGVPFKLSEEVSSNLENNLKETVARVDDILFQISQIEMDNYNYDFTLENAVTDFQ